MLRLASVSDLISGRINKDNGYIVITMRRYPRFVRRELRDEYISDMAPGRKLFEDWLSIKRRSGDHDAAFEKSNYENRFSMSSEGWEHLKRLSDLSKKRDVYFVCQCKAGQRCHREMLFLVAKRFFHSKTEKVKNTYPTFQRRITKSLLK